MREYWQTNDIVWLYDKRESWTYDIGMNWITTVKNGKETAEARYFLSSLPLDVQEIA